MTLNSGTTWFKSFVPILPCVRNLSALAVLLFGNLLAISVFPLQKNGIASSLRQWSGLPKTGSQDHFILSAIPFSSDLFSLDLPFSGASSVIAEQCAGLLNQVLVPGPEHDYRIFFLRIVAVLLL